MHYVAVTRDVSDFRKPLGRSQLDRLCRQAFGRAARPQSCQLIESGKFNTSYRIEFDRHTQVILRVAPPVEAPLFRHEKQLLRRESTVQPILNRLCARTPQNLFVDFSRSLIDRDYVFQNCLAGKLWDNVKGGLSADENADLWRQLGSIVKRIHAASHRNFGPPAPMPQFDCWSDAVVAWIQGMIEDMQCFGLPCHDALLFVSLVRAGRRHLDEIAVPRLVHGDLWPKNILIDRCADTVKITAVLDAERAFWGDPEAEWIFSFLDVPPPFWQVYGPLRKDPSALFRRLVYQGRGAIQLCLEAWRFHFDDRCFRDTLRLVNEALTGHGASAPSPGKKRCGGQSV